MATLYVENVPDELYQALRERARKNRRSMAAELMLLLEENVPTAKELKKRRDFLERMAALRSEKPLEAGPFPSSEEMQREDRQR